MLSAMYCLKERARDFGELIDKGQFILAGTPITPDEKALSALDETGRSILRELTPQLQNVIWTRGDLERVTSQIAETRGIGFGKIAAPIRAALAGRTATPSVFDMMLVLGRQETIARLTDISANEIKD
jgi:glutamyl-tRNA synthetase